jgi:nucleoside-diphosphate-sugar epimerase
MKKYLIIGASGFIGGNVLNILPSNIDIIIVTTNKKKIEKIIKNKSFLKYSIKNYNFISIKNKNIIQDKDIIINCTGAYPKKNNNKELIFLNYKFPKLLYNLSIGKKSKKFININTLLKNQKSKYVKYKHKLSDYFKSKLSNTNVLDLHVGHLYGDLNNEKEFIYSIIIKILKGEKILKLTKGKQKRDFIHIKDFLKFFILILKKEITKKYTKFEIGSSKSYSIKSVILIIKKIMSSNITTNFGYFNYKKGEDFSMKSNTKSLVNIKWKPSINLSTGIRSLINEIKFKQFNIKKY